MSLNKNLSSKINIDQLAKLLKVNTLNEFDDYFVENNYCSCSEELQNQNKCECGFEDSRTELYKKYMNAMELIGNRLLNEHGLRLENTKNDWEKKIVPVESWKDAADRIRMTINGYGMFEFNSLKEFLDSGPYTARGAVLNHLHWMRRWYEIYGSPNAANQLEKHLRY